MRPDESDLNEEIRGHLAIDIKERIDRGEDPVSARRAALREFGYVPAVHEEMRRVWYSRWYDQAEALARDVRLALRSLTRARAVTVTVVVTLALGIGANAAIFSVIRSVLLRPLVNRDADRLLYIRQTAQGIGTDNLTFSVPEITDFKSRATTIVRIRRLLHGRLHPDRLRPRASPGEGWCRQRLIFRGHGTSSHARPSVERRR